MGISSTNNETAPISTANSKKRIESHRGPSEGLPEEPLVVIEPKKAWSALDLRDVWAFRELLYFLTWRDVKVRYKQTLFGVAWVVVQPLLSTLIFTAFLGKLARVPSDGLPYPLFVYAAILPWTFFSQAVVNSGNSLVNSAHLITKVYFPRMIIPAAAVAARLLDFAIAFVILLGLMFYYGIRLGAGMLLLPFLTLLVALLAFALGMWLSAINVKYRDVGVALPVLIQFWMFASPVVYPASLVYASNLSQTWKVLYMLNPLVGIIENFRAAIFGTPFNWSALAVTCAFAIVMLVGGAYEFRRMERQFADVA
jgi:lipopolysaccharide transport system permease protein